MKVKNIQHSATAKLFLGILLGVCFMATAAHANSLFKGTFTLTKQLQWGQATLPPGQYSLVLEDNIPNIIISDVHTGKVVAFDVARPSYNGDSDDSKLLITVRGDHRAVYSVRLARFGEVFQTAHPSAGRGNGVEEAIPVQIAKK
ncbi:MAG TPA: hypothetical protein VGR97_03075 [Candidatus Acidoferrales bacterium]|nr:hypothetical protein [Candidatus Acidoferrales bacterium]